MHRASLRVLLAPIVLAPLAAGAASAQQSDTAAPAGDAAAPLEVRVNDLTPGFLTFYEAAVEENADADRRWQLWKEHYDFAALPPVPERDSIARELLDDAWPRYPDVIERIQAGVDGMAPAPEPLLQEVAAEFGMEEALRVDLLVYVGALEGNAFFAPQEGRLVVAVPIEEESADRTRSLVHEFTHAVHHTLADLSEGWERTVARTLFSEGLANRATEKLLPGGTPAFYLDGRPGWFEEAAARGGEILEGILPYVRDDDSEQVMRFTMGTGTTGIEREAYYAGWVVVGHLLESGHTLGELARVPEDEVTALVEQALTELTSEESSARRANER